MKFGGKDPKVYIQIVLESIFESESNMGTKLKPLKFDVFLFLNYKKRSTGSKLMNKILVLISGLRDLNKFGK